MITKSAFPNRLTALAAALLVSACGGGSGTAPESDTQTSGDAAKAATDITAAVLANRDVTLAGASVIALPPGVTTYTGVISGAGTLRITPAGGTSQPGVLVVTRTSTFTLPVARQVEKITKTTYAGMGYALDIAGIDPPAVTVDVGATLRFGTNTSADASPNFLATSNSLNPASVVNGEINLDNLLVNGTLEINSANFVLLGQVSGSGSVNQLAGVWGDHSMGGTNTMTGVVALAAGHNFGSNHVKATLPAARAVVNEGSWLVWCPPERVLNVSQHVYEASYGGDINFHAIGTGRIVMTGVYSHTDNSPHGTPNLVNPGLSDASLNLAKVIYRGTNSINGNDASYRGVNIEGGGVVQWGDGTGSDFFLPSTPAPAEFAPALGAKNAYINLRRGGTLAFDYNAPVTLNIGITGGGGGPYRDGSVGVGNVTVMGTAGNDVTFAQPQNYNGTTTIEAGAILRLGTGAGVPLNYATINNGVKSTALIATYSGDGSLLTAASANGAATDAIVNNGRLVVQNTAAAITLAAMTGAGSLTQAGPATTTLQGNGFSGGTTITAGQVLAGDASAFGAGDVVNGAKLGFAGGVAAASIGGNFRQSAGATLTVPADANGAGHLAVAGSATLGGALVLNITGTPASGKKFVLIDAAGGLTGSFASVATNGVSVTPGHDATSFWVVVQ